MACGSMAAVSTTDVNGGGETVAWLRLYDDIIDDHKFEDFSHSQRWLWITVLCLANRSPVRGKLLVAENHPIPTRTVAKKADVTEEAAEASLALFESLHMLHREDGILCVTNWDKRQFTSDCSTERVRRHRKQPSAQDETFLKRFNPVSGNVSETDQKQKQKQNTEADINTNPLTPLKGEGDGYSSDFEEFWALYPRKINKKVAYRQWQARKRQRYDMDEFATSARNYALTCQGKPAEYIMHPATFIGRDERWKHYLDPPPAQQPRAAPAFGAFRNQQPGINLQDETMAVLRSMGVDD